MRLSSGQPRAEFALFTRLRSTCGTTHCKSLFRSDLHRYTMHGCTPTRWSILTIARSYRRRIISVDKVDGQESAATSPDWKLVPAPSVLRPERIGDILTNIRFVVKVSRGSLAPAFVQRIDPPVQMTTNRKRALTMGKLTAEDAIKSIQNSKCVPELVPVHVDV